MIDLHSDAIYRLRCTDKPYSLLSSPYCVTKEHLEKAGVGAQCFALYVNTALFPHSPWTELNVLHDRFAAEIDNAGIPQMRSADDYDGTLHAVLTTEDGASIEGDISRLRTLKDWGVMIFGITWNRENELGYPNSKDRSVMEKGLKEKGFEAISECERLGIAVDVSHLSDGGFWDVVRASHKPFLATHSNARSVTDATRNLTDDMIRAIADKGGVIGVCFHPSFLGPVPSNPDEAVSHISDMARHVEHVYRTGGEDVIAIGTDIDGIPGSLEVDYPECFDALFAEMGKRGFPDSVMDKFRVGNALRFFSDMNSNH